MDYFCSSTCRFFNTTVICPHLQFLMDINDLMNEGSCSCRYKQPLPHQPFFFFHAACHVRKLTDCYNTLIPKTLNYKHLLADNFTTSSIIRVSLLNCNTLFILLLLGNTDSCEWAVGIHTVTYQNDWFNINLLFTVLCKSLRAP